MRRILIFIKLLIKQKAQFIGGFFKDLIDMRSQFLIVTNKLDRTGGAQVVRDMLVEARNRWPNRRFKVVAEIIDAESQQLLQDLNVEYIHFAPQGAPEETFMQLGLKDKDKLIFSLSDIPKAHIERALEIMHGKQFKWYVHEDDPERMFSDADFKGLVQRHLKQGHLKLFAVSRRVKQNLQRFFDTKQIDLCYYKLSMPLNMPAPKVASDFQRICFAMTGNANDGRKGQIAIVYALGEFYKRHYQQNPGKYREFELRLLGLHDDYQTMNIRQIGIHTLGKRLKIYGRLSRSEILSAMSEANCTICYSRMEALPIFVFEGMYLSHPLLRNNVAGAEEQLQPGENGFLLEDDLEEVISSFELMLNIEKTSDEKLVQMGRKSQEIASKFTKYDFSEILD